MQAVFAKIAVQSLITEPLSAKSAAHLLQNLMMYAKIADINLNARANSALNAGQKDSDLRGIEYETVGL